MDSTFLLTRISCGSNNTSEKMKMPDKKALWFLLVLSCLSPSHSSYVVKLLENACYTHDIRRCSRLRFVRNATASDTLVPGLTWIATAQHTNNKVETNNFPWDNLCHWGEGIFPLADAAHDAQRVGKIDHVLLHQMDDHRMQARGYVKVVRNGVLSDWFVNTAVGAAALFTAQSKGDVPDLKPARNSKGTPALMPATGLAVKNEDWPEMRLCRSLGAGGGARVSSASSLPTGRCTGPVAG